MSNGKDNAGKMLLTAGAAGGVAAIVTKLLQAKPVEAAAPEEAKWDYLIACQECIIALLGELITAVGAIAPLAPGVEVTVKAPWVAKDPEQIYSQDIRVIGTFYSDKMVDWTRGKRFLIKIESSLNVDCDVQVIGNFVDNMPLASDINAPIDVGADENHSVGLAWDDWHPFIGVRITTAVAPTAGILNIWAVIQE